MDIGYIGQREYGAVPRVCGDILPEAQRKTGYAMQSVMIGAGAVIASFLPQILTAVGVSTEALLGHIPNTVKYSFYIGALVLIAAILATIKTTPEYPPADMAEFNNLKNKRLIRLKQFGKCAARLSQCPLQCAVWLWCSFYLGSLYGNVGIFYAGYCFGRIPRHTGYGGLRNCRQLGQFLLWHL